MKDSFIWNKHAIQGAGLHVPAGNVPNIVTAPLPLTGWSSVYGATISYSGGVVASGYTGGMSRSLGGLVPGVMATITVELKYVRKAPCHITVTDDVTSAVIASQSVGSGGFYSLSFTPTGNNVTLSIVEGVSFASSGMLVHLVTGTYTQQQGWTTAPLAVQITNKDADKYKFGFNGQEKVNEIAGIGNHTTALFWEYDTRIARRWNRDPKTGSYPHLSPYSVFKGNPIIYNDKDGDIGHLVIVDNAKEGGGTVFIVATYYTVKGGVEKNGFSAAQMSDIKNIETHLNAQNYKVTDDISYGDKNLNGYKVQFVLNIKEVDSKPDVRSGSRQVTFGIPNAKGSESITPNNTLANYAPKAFKKLEGVSDIAKQHKVKLSDIGAVTTQDELNISKQDGVNAYEWNGATFGSNILHEMFHTWGVNKDGVGVEEKSIGTGSATPNSDDVNQAVKSLVNSGHVSEGTAAPEKR